MNIGVLLFIPSIQSACVRFTISNYPRMGERDSRNTRFLFQPCNDIACLALFKYLASFLNTLDMFPPPFLHDFPLNPWWAQHSSAGSSENTLIQCAKLQWILESCSYFLSLLNGGWLLIWLQRTNLINTRQ